MARALGPVLKTIVFTIFVPGTVGVLVPWWIAGGFRIEGSGVLTWLGFFVIVVGAAIYFRCAWEFAVRGLGTPAPIAPTKFLVTTALHRHVRNPMYIGVALVIFGEAMLFRSLHVAEYGVAMLLTAHFSWFSTRNQHSDGNSVRSTKSTAELCRAGSRDYDTMTRAQPDYQHKS